MLRGNIEEQEGNKNSIDPMMIQIEWRDRYPKMGLDGKYVGDQYMICADIPSKMFLRKGAKYRLLGSKKESQLQHPQRDSQGNVVSYTLDASSELLAQLCRDDNGKCTFPSLVELEQNVKCFGVECSLDIVQVVQVHGIYYEYVKPACINFPFFDEGRTILKRQGDGSEIPSGCVDQSFQSNAPYYQGHYLYTQDGCDVAVIVDLDGTIAIEQQNRTNYASLTFFQVHWENSEYPHKKNNRCGYGLCEKKRGRCRCRVAGVQNKVRFTSLPSHNDVLSQLSIGAVPTDIMDYHSTVTTEDGISVHFKTQTNLYDIDTTFEVIDEFGRRKFLKNLVSVVKLNTPFSKIYEFRNPPVFYNTIPELR